jgi:hypothetical protein
MLAALNCMPFVGLFDNVILLCSFALLG